MKKNDLSNVFALFVLFLLFPLQVNSKIYEANEIENLVKQYAETKYIALADENEKISISTPEIDPRITINECDSKLEVNILENNNSRNINVKISCELPEFWQMFLPLKIKRLLPVLVAASNLNKGSVLDHDNTEVLYIEEHKIRGETLSDNTQILGAKLKSNIQKGSAVYSNNICLVCKGEEVVIIASSDVFEIKTEGTALTNGTIGQQVKIKNNRSGKVISGRVDAINKVVINL